MDIPSNDEELPSASREVHLDLLPGICYIANIVIIYTRKKYPEFQKYLKLGIVDIINFNDIKFISTSYLVDNPEGKGLVTNFRSLNKRIVKKVFYYVKDE
eukprot:GHVL01023918.1.p1 GENE.GHVL01023918.1~~GHVL01023918.1.p1  ORF type:complete len:100 (+),score=2.19 GHVL01023918.1:632-931(+)